jgi:CubicO group peptidase (beta-lactamase class C family)
MRQSLAIFALGALALFGPLQSRAAVDAAPAGGASILSWTPEQQAYGYRHMETLVPTKVVRRGTMVRALPTAPEPIDAAFSQGGVRYTIDSYMKAFRVSGLIAIKNGRIVLERYGLGRTPDERWTSFSVAKSVTSTLIGAAIQDGKISSLDDPVTRYIPQLAGGAYGGVTIRQLLTMTSGVKWNEDYSDPNSDVAKVGFTPPEPGVNPIVSYMRRLPREAPAGTKFVYKTGETDLAGVLLSNAVGESMSDYFSRKIWAPFGMEQDAAWVLDSAGHERGGCCLSMTLRDYGRLGLFMLEGGKAGGNQVVPAGWIEDATRAHVAKPKYGYFWWIVPGGYEAEGIYGQVIAVFPADHLVIAMNSAWAQADPDANWEAEYALMKAIRAASRATTAADQPIAK